MIAYITSIGEPTTDLCVWSLQRNGFEVHILKDNSSLSSKLVDIYASANEDFLRVDADVVVNRNLIPLYLNTLYELDEEIWWWQFRTFDWWKQDTTTGGVQFIRREAIEHLRNNISDHLLSERPETEMSRIKEFYEPRRFEQDITIMGIHGFKNDPKRILETKIRRGQDKYYDFELAEKLNEL